MCDMLVVPGEDAEHKVYNAFKTIAQKTCQFLMIKSFQIVTSKCQVLTTEHLVVQAFLNEHENKNCICQGLGPSASVNFTLGFQNSEISKC